MARAVAADRRSGASYLAIVAAVYFFLRAGSVLVAVVPALVQGERQILPMLQFAAVFRQPNVFWAFLTYFALFALSYVASSWTEHRRGLGGVLGAFLFLLAAGDAAGLLLTR